MAERIIDTKEEESKRYLYLSGYDWRSWTAKANALRKSAHILWTSYKHEMERLDSLGEAAVGQSFELEYEKIAMMLMGMAIENLLKSILLVRDPSLVEDGKIARKLQTHNLLKLLDWTSISIDIQDTQLCTLLSDFILWHGRYPAPLKSTNIRGALRRGYEWKSLDDLFVKIFQSVSEKELAEADRVYSSKQDKVRSAFFRKSNPQNAKKD